MFIASRLGDSQLIRLLQERDETTKSYVELLDTFTNLGPISHMCVIDIDKQGRGQIVTCSGGNKDGSLRIVRNGVGVDEQCNIDLNGVKGLWSLKLSLGSRYDSFLVQSFSTETRVLGFSHEDTMEIEGDEQSLTELTVNDLFESNSPSLYCGNTIDDWIVQVTPFRVRYLKSSFVKISTTASEFIDWIPPASTRITLASPSLESNVFSLAIALTGGKIVLLSAVGEELKEFQMEHEVACFTLSDNFLVVGLWSDLSIRIFDKSSGKELHHEASAGDEALPRSLVITRFGGQTKRLHLLAGLGDGRLIIFTVDELNGVIVPNSRRVIPLGTQPVELILFDDSSSSSKHVFAACDRPAIVYAAHGEKLLLSNVNLSMEVTHVAPFDSEAFPACLALASEEKLVIGTVNDVQKVHVRTIPLGVQPRRIAHQPSSNTFGLCVIKIDDSSDTEPQEGELLVEFPESCFVRLLDERTFEVLDSFSLDETEHALSIISMRFSNEEEGEEEEEISLTKSYYIVGTAFASDDEPEPTRGRILVFEVVKFESDKDRKLVLITEKVTKGAVYDLCSFSGQLLAGINARIQLYRWNDKPVTSQSSSTPRPGNPALSLDLLSEVCSYHGHTITLFIRAVGRKIIVGDLVKSVSVLTWEPQLNQILDHSRDFNATWVNAMEILDDSTYLSADIFCNMIVVKPEQQHHESEENRLVVAGDFHWGDSINVFCKGSLVMRQKQEEEEPTTDSSIVVRAVPKLLFGTASGAIGVLATITAQEFAILDRLQKALNIVSEGICKEKQLDWRAFRNGGKTHESKGFIDGDLIETLLEMNHSEIERVTDLVNRGLSGISRFGNNISTEEPKKVTVNGLISLVEELTRLH